MAMASTEEGRKLNWIKRLRRKRVLSAEDNSSLQDSSCPSRIQTLKARLSRKLLRTHTEPVALRWTTREECFRTEDDLSASCPNSNAASSSGSFKQLSVELDRHQKCVTNLAATVVRQNKEIREMQNYIAALQSHLLQHGLPVELDYHEVGSEAAELEP